MAFINGQVRDLSWKPSIYVSWSTSELRMRLVPWNTLKPSSKNSFTYCSKAVLLLWIIFVKFCVSNPFLSVGCSIMVTCWEMAVLLARLYVKFSCVIVTFQRWCPGSGVVLDCIDSWYLPYDFLPYFYRWPSLLQLLQHIWRRRMLQ